MKPCLLLVGGRPKVLRAAEDAFPVDSARVTRVAGVAKAWASLAKAPPPHLIVLCAERFGKPESDAVARLRADLRLADSSVLVLVEKADDSSAVRALGQGADEFLSEPMEAAELSARLRAMLRRLLAPPAPSRLAFHDLGIVEATREVSVGERAVALTDTQFKVLQLLMQKAGRVLARDHIIKHLWQTPEHVATRSADMHISILRKKLSASACRIETVRPFGYRLIGPQPVRSRRLPVSR